MAVTLLAASAAPAAAAGTVDAGSVAVGESAVVEHDVSLTASLSDLPPETVLYGGGNIAVDVAVSTMGLSSPVTAGSLLAVTGEVTLDFHVSFAPTPSTDFAIDDTDCETGTGSCTLGITFSPTDTGTRAATAEATIGDVQVTGGGSYAALMELFAPFLAPQVEGQLDLPLTGEGTDGESGGIVLEVDVEPAAVPCVLVSTTLIDFGTRGFSTPDQINGAERDLTVTSCSTGPQAILASGTDAAGDGDPAGAWSLSGAGGNPCLAGTDVYGVVVSGDAGDGNATLQLSTSQADWLTMAAGAVAAETSLDYQMPCEGSSGAGQTMTSRITFTATAP